MAIKKTKGRAATWWGKRWTSAMEGLSITWRNRLPRGRTYAREGRVVGLRVESGLIGAYVVGTRPSPYEVEIRLTPLNDRQWGRVVQQLASRASYAARLLAGEMPDDIEEAFEESRVALFPISVDDFQLDCSCPDHALPCKHIAGAHYALGEALDHDPFLLFALRGRDRTALLDELGDARSGSLPKRTKAKAKKPRARRGSRTDSAFGAEEFLGKASELAEIRFRIVEPSVRMAVIRGLGRPAGWRERQPITAVLDDAYAAAARKARELALGDDATEVNDAV